MREGKRFVRFASRGQADLWGVEWYDTPYERHCKARHWEIEVKRPGNRPTALQLEWLKSMTDLGCVAFWADSANIAERVADAVIRGGTIVWHSDDAYDVRMEQ